MNIYLRPLRVEDAYTSFRWRNNIKIWEFTGSKPDKYISLENELEWIKEVLKNKNEKRFAICVVSDNTYIGNVQLTGICKDEAEFHIFIGDTNYWGKGIGKDASKKMLAYGFNELKLKSVFLYVNEFNLAAITIYKDLGFQIISKNPHNQYLMKIINDNE